MGVTDSDVQKLVVAAMRLRSLVDPGDSEYQNPVEFSNRPLPDEFQTLSELAAFYSLGGDLPVGLIEAMAYAIERGIDWERYSVGWSPKMPKRLIVPCTWKQRSVGYLARSLTQENPKYLTEHDRDYVFNVDDQRPGSKFVLVVEGAFDAMALGGVAVLGSSITDTQADIVDYLNREVIVVPDFDFKTDKHGHRIWTGSKMVDAALEYGWSVSFPEWSATCKDVSAACQKHGRLFALKAVLEATQRTRLKIQLASKRLLHA